jgi:cytochrome c oxidase subunit IV
MVLDSKALGWASQNGLDTAALKKAKVPIYGKWYFPDLPADVPLVNLQTGQVETFGQGYRAGAILYAKEEDLKRAKLGPYATPAEPPAAPAAPEPSDEAVAAAAAPDRPPREVLEQERPSDELVEAAAAVGAGAGAPTAVATQTPVQAPQHGAHGHEDHGPVEHVGHAPVVHEQSHPSPKAYVVIALILAVITAIEVAVYYIPALLGVIVPILLVLSALKFTMVVGYFMHLKFDHKLYTGLFAGGLVIAATIVGALIILFLGGAPAGGGH